MQTNFYKFLNLRNTIYLLFAAASFFIIQSYRLGPAKDDERTVTGAPFNSGQTCSRCHSGGSFGGSIITELLDVNNASVAAYIPGASYNFRITLNKTMGTPQYGFQTTAATTASATNINNWGALPANTHNQLVSGRNYVEHSTRLAAGIISIPWTAPAKGTGSVTFWTAGNLVNGTGSSSGDQPVNTNLVIEEDQLVPVTIKYFKGSLQNGHAVLEWATAQEINNKEFIIEKSLNTRDFVKAATIPAHTNGMYSWTDLSFKDNAYYRLVQVDMDGTKHYHSMVEVRSLVSAYGIALQAHAGAYFIMFSNGKQQQPISISVFDMNGKPIHTQKAMASEGSNMYELPVKISGTYIIAIQTQDGIRTTSKIQIVR